MTCKVTEKSKTRPVPGPPKDRRKLPLNIIREMKKSYKTNGKKGSALVYIFVIIIVLSVLTTTVLSILASNTRQVQYQQDKMEAYYLAYSGVQMAYSALLANSNAKMTELTRTTNPVAEQRQTNTSFGNGKITVVAKLSADTGYEGWIIITSTGTLDLNGVQYTRIMYFDPANPVDIVWKNN
jgi:type II secretory pathway component PulK